MTKEEIEDKIEKLEQRPKTEISTKLISALKNRLTKMGAKVNK